MATRVQEFITHADPTVTLTQNTPNVLSTIFTYQVPRGLAAVIPGEFPLILKLQKADGSEINILSEFYFFVQVPTEGKLLFPVSSRIIYHPWADLSLQLQRNRNYQAATKISLGVDFLPIVEEEKLVIQLYSTDQIDTSKVRIYIPYFEKLPTDVEEEMAYRAEVLNI